MAAPRKCHVHVGEIDIAGEYFTRALIKFEKGDVAEVVRNRTCPRLVGGLLVQDRLHVREPAFVSCPEQPKRRLEPQLIRRDLSVWLRSGLLCKRPSLTVFRWIFPHGHKIGRDCDTVSGSAARRNQVGGSLAVEQERRERAESELSVHVRAGGGSAAC
jgi:hypothetical protein